MDPSTLELQASRLFDALLDEAARSLTRTSTSTRMRPCRSAATTTTATTTTGDYYFYGYGGDDTFAADIGGHWNGYDDLWNFEQVPRDTCGSHDGDCCGYDYETWCADGYTLAARGTRVSTTVGPGTTTILRGLPNGVYDDDYDYSGGNYAYNDGYDDDDGMCCEPDEYHYDWDEAYDMCESTGMRQIYARATTTARTAVTINWNPNNADEYTHGCCATDFEVYMHGDRNYWISVTGARNNARPKRAPCPQEREARSAELSPNARVPPDSARAGYDESEDKGHYHLNVYCEHVDDDAYHADNAVDQWWGESETCDCSCYTRRRVQLLRLHVQLL